MIAIQNGQVVSSRCKMNNNGEFLIECEGPKTDFNQISSEAAWNKHLSLGLGYECKQLCNQIRCYRYFTNDNMDSIPKEEREAELIGKCSPDGTVSGYDQS